MAASQAPIPPPRDNDDDDVALGLTTAAACYKRGDISEALRWLQRAARAAGDADDDDRALELARAAAELAAQTATAIPAASIPPPAQSPAPTAAPTPTVAATAAPKPFSVPPPPASTPRPMLSHVGAKPSAAKTTAPAPRSVAPPPTSAPRSTAAPRATPTPTPAPTPAPTQTPAPTSAPRSGGDSVRTRMRGNTKAPVPNARPRTRTLDPEATTQTLAPPPENLDAPTRALPSLPAFQVWLVRDEHGLRVLPADGTTPPTGAVSAVLLATDVTSALRSLLERKE